MIINLTEIFASGGALAILSNSKSRRFVRVLVKPAGQHRARSKKD